MDTMQAEHKRKQDNFGFRLKDTVRFFDFSFSIGFAPREKHAEVHRAVLTLTGLNKMNSVSLLDKYKDMLRNVDGSFVFIVL